jgi:hypothetical protein
VIATNAKISAVTTAYDILVPSPPTWGDEAPSYVSTPRSPIRRPHSIRYRYLRLLSKLACFACDTPDELGSVTEHRRQNSQTGRKGSYQREMTDPAISLLLGNPAMGADLCCHSTAVAGTD